MIIELNDAIDALSIAIGNILDYHKQHGDYAYAKTAHRLMMVRGDMRAIRDELTIYLEDVNKGRVSDVLPR